MAVPTPHPQQGPRAVLSRWCSAVPLGAEDRPLAQQWGGSQGRGSQPWAPAATPPTAGMALGCAPRYVSSSDVRALEQVVFSLCPGRAQAGDGPFPSCLAQPGPVRPKEAALREKGARCEVPAMCLGQGGPQWPNCNVSILLPQWARALHGPGPRWFWALGVPGPRGHSEHSVHCYGTNSDCLLPRTGVKVHTTWVSVYCIWETKKQCIKRL